MLTVNEIEKITISLERCEYCEEDKIFAMDVECGAVKASQMSAIAVDC